jgi:predicted permease
MAWLRWFRRARSGDDFSDEIRSHLAIETDRLIADGRSPDEAAAAARRAFGNVTRATERYHESRRIGWLDHLRQDLRGGARSLRRYPIAAIVAVLSLAAGIGATTTFLTIRDVIFEKAPPLYADPWQLSKVQVNRQDRLIMPIGSYVPGDLYATWRDTMGLTMAASLPPRGVRDVRLADRVEPVNVRAVTATFFTVLGVSPVAGRGFFAAETNAGARPALLSYQHWQEWFGGRDDAIGSTLWIDNVPHTIVGVMPARFWFSDFAPPVWTLLDAAALSAGNDLQVVIRRPGDMSHNALAARLRGSLMEYSAKLPAGRGPLQMRISAIKGTPLGDGMSIILPFVLGASVMLTLLIACANVAILMIAQWTTRELETAVRTALGATRWRLVRALVAESVLLAVCAGVLGVCVMLALRGIFLSGSRLFVQVLDLSINPVVFLQVAAVTILTGIAAGLGPALFETRSLQVDPLRGLRTSDHVRQRWSHALVVLEIMVTMALLVVAASLITGFERSSGEQMGFDPQRILTASVENRNGLPVPQLLETLRQIPGVASVAAANGVPLGGRGVQQPASMDSTGANAVVAEWISMSEEFFSTLGVPMRAGRAFTSEDTALTGTAIVAEGLARQLYGDSSAIGRQIWAKGKAYDVIGVVADYTSQPTAQRLPFPKVFLPIATPAREITTMRFVIRADSDPSSLVQPIRRALRDAAPGMVVSNTYTYRQMLSLQGQETLLGTAPLFPLIVIGMMLTASGIYGVLAFAISRRSREIAVRVAIGADRGNQIRLVMAHSLRLVMIGLALGIALTFGLSRVVRASGGAGSMYDPELAAFVLPVVMVLAVAALATWIPVRRALRINPASLLKAN